MPKQLSLTPRKRKWAEARKNPVLRGTRLNYNASQQAKYQKAILTLVRQMTSETKSQVIKLFESSTADDFFEQQKQAAAMDASNISVKAKKLMNTLNAKFTNLFNDKAKPIAEKMIDGASDASENALHESLKQLSGGLSLKTGVVPEGMEIKAQALVQENVGLITSIPSKYFEQISGAVYRSITTGNGIKDLIPVISKYNGENERRAKNIALDQTRKAYNTINRERMQKVGVKQFEWIHSGGGVHPRPSHVAMSGKIFSFDDLPIVNLDNAGSPSYVPERGIPGQAINCKCVMSPVIEFDTGE